MNTHLFITLLRWDYLLQIRYHLLTAVAVVTAGYVVIFSVLQHLATDELLIILVFSDPVMLGFLCIGALVLFEQDAGTLQALVVTPVRTWHYLWSKALTLTLTALVCAIGMAVIARGANFNLVWFCLAVVLSSIVFVFVGFTGITRVATFNTYLLIVPVYLAPACLPLLTLFGFDAWGLYLLPTQATILLLRAAFEVRPGWEVWYGISYLLLWTAIAYRVAAWHYNRYIVHRHWRNA